MSHGAIVYDGSVQHFVTESAIKKHLIVDFTEPLKNDLTLLNGLKIARGALMYEQDLDTAELLPILQTLYQEASIRDLKIEEPEGSTRMPREEKAEEHS